MQIFFDDEQFHREYRGGVSRYLCDLSTALVRHCQVPVTIFGGWSRSHVLRDLPAQPGLRVVHLPRNPSWSIATAAWRASTPWRRWSFMQALRRDPDTVYHPNLYRPDPWIQARAPVMVCTFHDMQLEIEGGHGRHASRLGQAKIALASDAERIICVSDNTRIDLERLIPAATGKTRVVHIDSSIAPPPEQPASVSSYFLYVGNRHGYKNGRAVLAAFARLAVAHPMLRLRLCGGKSPGEDGEFDGLDAELLSERIDWCSPDDVELARLYAGALALLYPSDYEGFGLPVLEAMRCGCPVVTTAVSSLPEVGGDAACYIAPGDFDAMGNWMRRLMTEPALRDDLRRRGQLQASRFSWEATANGFARVAREALLSRRPSR